MIKDNAYVVTLDQTEPLFKVYSRASIFISLIMYIFEGFNLLKLGSDFIGLTDNSYQASLTFFQHLKMAWEVTIRAKYEFKFH